MLRYTLLRLLGAIPTLLLVIVLAFMMMRAAPGGPFDSERVLPPEIEANIEAEYDLDQPLPLQLLRYLGNAVHGDLGPSYRYRDRRVSELIGRGLGVSVTLGSAALLLALAVGISAGVFAALHHNRWTDRLLTGAAMAGLSVPVFVIAPVLVLFLAVKLQWLPAGWTGQTGFGRYLLPVISLALPLIAYIARLTRASMIDVLQSDFIRTAKAQGLGTGAIIRYHALKPALLPLMSYMGPAIAALLTGSVVVEEIFAIPGLGQAFVRGALNRDYTLVLGIVIFYAVLVITLNLIVDILYGVIDPRIRRR